MFKRLAPAMWLLVLLSFVAGCGGGGGGDGDVDVRPNVTSLQFSAFAGEPMAPQNINVELTNATGTVYALVEVADPGVAFASFSITGGTTATITVTPSASLPVGTHQTTVFLRIYRNPNGTDLLATFSYAVTVTVRAGMTVNPTSLSLGTLEGAATQGTLAVTLPAGLTGTVQATLAPGQPAAPWLLVSVVNNNTVQVAASAASLVAGVYQRELEVSVVRPAGVSVVRVPLTLTVGVGLVAPASQTLALQVDTPLASLAGQVPVARADGQSAAYTATSSAPWLVLGAGGAGTTPSQLGFAVDAAQAAQLPPFVDSTATVTITTPGLAPVSFSVTLQNRLPYVSSSGPYGVLARVIPVRILVGGRGFSQISDPVATLLSSGMNVHSATVLSDTQIEAQVSMAAGGFPVTVRIPNAANIATPSALQWFSEAVDYGSATVPHIGPKSSYLHDPVRRAVFALRRDFAGGLVRYQFDGSNWNVAFLSFVGVNDMALAPDGSRIWLTDSSSFVNEVDPDAMTVLNRYHPSGFGIGVNIGGVLPVSSDGRMWLPGGAHYFDLRTRTFGTLSVNPPFDIEFGKYHGSLDGSRVLISPSYSFTPLPRYGAYEPLNGQVSNPMGVLDLGYEPRLSADGSLTLLEYTGQLFNRGFLSLGQLPTPPDVDSYHLVTLTPDGSKVLVLRKTYTHPSKFTLASQAIDIYSTTQFAPGTADFVKIGTLPITTDASICTSSSNDCYYGNQYLLPSVDSKTLFWIGNQNMQVFSLP